jgi:hypothetical protein
MRRNGKRGGARRSSNKGISELIQTARDQNWVVISSAGGHWIFRPPDKSMPQVVASGTPGGNNRSVENTKAQLKRSGLVLNGRRRLRRNPSMKTSTMIGIGVVAAAAAYFLLRPSSTTIMTAAGPVSVPTAPSGAMSPLAQQREQMITMIMVGERVSREAAIARYNALTVRPVSGFGSYYRS